MNELTFVAITSQLLSIVSQMDADIRSCIGERVDALNVDLFLGKMAAYNSKIRHALESVPFLEEFYSYAPPSPYTDADFDDHDWASIVIANDKELYGDDILTPNDIKAFNEEGG